MSPYSYSRFLFLALALALFCGCSSYQPVKNVWKGTKGLWNTYVSPPASVNYEDKGDLPPQARELSTAMLGVDKELTRLERVMQNADKPPTQQWLDNLFASFPWLSGFAGIKYDGKILGQQPADSLKDLDFNPLLYEDKKQNSHALRADVQPSPMGPEVMLATPLYDGVDFLGIVVAYFDMRALMAHSANASDIVALCPTALLWPGKYDFAATPLAGVDWAKVVTESSAGTCSNATGSFFYMVRYLGNLPIIFAIPEKGTFPEGNGALEQGFAFFPPTREKVAPPPAPEHAPIKESPVESFGKSEDEEEAIQQPQPEEVETPVQTPEPASRGRGGHDANEIQPGSNESILLRKGKGSAGRNIQERPLEGENVEVERVRRPRQPAEPTRKPEPAAPLIDVVPESQTPRLPSGRPSPFGPREVEEPSTPDTSTPEEAPTPARPTRPSPFGPAETAPPPATSTAPTPETSAAPEENQNRLADGEKSESAPPDDGAANAPPEPAKPGVLPGGRPSPFGPGN